MKKKSITVAILTIMLAASTILSGCSGSGTETQKKTETSVEQTDQKDTDQNVQPVTRGLKQMFLYSTQAGLPA